MTDNKTLKAGIIGYGYMGKWHHNRIGQIEGIEVTSACDILEARRGEAAQAGLAAFEDIGQFLAQGLDLVIVATPNDAHSPCCIAALRAGCNVLCEKPVALNLAEFDRMIAVSRQAGKLFTVHQNRRWDADYLVVREAIRSGSIGNPVAIESRVHGERGVVFGWRAEPQAGGGMLYDWGVHLIDQILCMFPERRVTHVFARLKSVLTPLVDDYLKVEMLFDGGLEAHVEVGTFALQKMPRWFVYGDRGTLKLDDFTGKTGGLSKIRREPGEDLHFDERHVGGPSRTMAPLTPEDIVRLDIPAVEDRSLLFYRNLVGALRGTEKPAVTPESVRRTMAVIDAAFASGRRNNVVELSEWSA